MKKFIGAVAFAFLPVAAFAQTDFEIGGIEALVDQVGNLIQTMIPFVAALALLFFFYGLAKFILAAGNEDAKDEGKRIMFWGIIALFVMASIWGIIQVLGSLFGVDQGGTIDVPTEIE
jgi:hypothetical protein